VGELSDNIEGIGPVTESRLANAGIATLVELGDMNVQEMHEATGISASKLKSWKAMAMLQSIEGVDRQFAEALVKMGIFDFRGLAETDPNMIVERLDYYQSIGTIPNTATLDEVGDWQVSATVLQREREIFEPALLPFEVDVVWETMTCRGIRNYYEAPDHKCRWFHQFGPFHAYDVEVEDIMSGETGYMRAYYAGRRYQIPELLSGCRKAPIMSVGLNPNLRAVKDPKRIYPYFDDIQQYAKHFRYRTTYKYSIDDVCYDEHYEDPPGYAVFEMDEFIPLQKENVSMYKEYDKILKTFAQGVGITDSNLALAEDVSYYNFVACHSPRWDMDTETEVGITDECFKKRGFFLRQLEQSSPKVVILFGEPIMESFVENFGDKFEGEAPKPSDTYGKTLENNNYLMNLNENRMRVIFSPHPTGARYWYSYYDALNKIVDVLSDEYNNGYIAYDENLKHLKRSEGDCKFCKNDIFFIGECKYR